MSFFLHKNLPWLANSPKNLRFSGDPSFPKKGIKRGALPKMVIKEGYSNKPVESILKKRVFSWLCYLVPS